MDRLVALRKQLEDADPRGMSESLEALGFRLVERNGHGSLRRPRGTLDEVKNSSYRMGLDGRWHPGEARELAGATAGSATVPSECAPPHTNRCQGRSGRWAMIVRSRQASPADHPLVRPVAKACEARPRPGSSVG